MGAIQLTLYGGETSQDIAKLIQRAETQALARELHNLERRHGYDRSTCYQHLSWAARRIKNYADEA